MKLRALLAASLSLIALPADAQRNNWTTPTDGFRIIGNVYYVGTAGIGVYLFKGTDGHVLLDGGMAESVPAVEANIQKLGVKLTDIKWILNSHAHYDHSAGLAQLKKDTGAKLAAMEGDVSALEGGFYLGSESTRSMGAPPVKVDRVLKDGDTVELPGVKLVAHLTPGHTRGCTSWGTTVSEGGESYEVLDFCSATVAANRITPPLQYAGIVEDYRKTFKLAKTLKVDVPLAPHPDFFGLLQKAAKVKAGAPNPFVDPTAFKPFIEKAEADFEATLKQRTADAAKKPN